MAAGHLADVPMKPQFRIIDTGVRDGRRQIAFDGALIELHKVNRSPDTIRFLGFPPTVLIGRHQAMSHEVNVPLCRKERIGLVRRITGGGAIYLDQGQVGWEIVLSRKHLPMSTLASYAEGICKAIAYGLASTFSIDARFRQRNEIEVDGRKLCGSGGFFDGDSLIYQGTVLVDADPAQMINYLNIPGAHPSLREQKAVEARIVSLKALCGGQTPAIAEVKDAILLGLGEYLGIFAHRGNPSCEEEALATKLFDEELGTERFTFEIDDPRGANVLEARKLTHGGTIAAFVRLDGPTSSRRIREVLLTGDFFILPPRLLYDLEASLRGEPVDTIAAAINRYFARNRPSLLTICHDDIRAVILAATGTQSTT